MHQLPHYAIRTMVLTPTRRVWKEPDRTPSNRILAHFVPLVSCDAFLVVHFRDEDAVRPLAGTTLKSLMLELFDEGMVVGEAHFRVLHWSNSQMRTGGLWMYAPPPGCGISCEDIRQWVFPEGPPSASPCKYASRMALFFSASRPTIDIPHRPEHVVADIARGGFVFTDGCGRMRLEEANAVAHSIGLDRTPSAYQIRYGGVKGVVVVHPGPLPHALELPHSMVKFASSDASFEVINWAAWNPGRLNRQIITLLLDREVPLPTIVRYMELALMEAGRVMVDPPCAASRLGDLLGTMDVRYLLRRGVQLVDDPYFATVLQFLYRTDVNRFRTKTHIPLEKAAVLLGVCDFRGDLREDQVFVQIDEGGDAKRVITGPVLVTKNPCLHPGDILCLNAVDIPALRHIVNCVVFPVTGPRPLPDKISGSDLDGDMYFCTWEPDLVGPVRQTECEPMDFTASGHGTLTVGNTEDSLRRAMREYYVECATGTSLGVIANAHIVHADKDGATCPACLQLARLHSDAVDAPKTGSRIEVPRELRPQSYPAWMEKEDERAQILAQETPLQVLYDLCPVIAKPDDVEVAPDPVYHVVGHETFLEKASEARWHYVRNVLAIMRRYGAKLEAEAVTGRLDRGFVGREKEIREQEMTAAMRALHTRTREEFENQVSQAVEEDSDNEEEDTRYRVAAAWYHDTYAHPVVKKKLFLSFAWIAAPELSALAQKADVRRRCHMHDTIAHSAARLYSAKGSGAQEYILCMGAQDDLPRLCGWLQQCPVLVSVCFTLWRWCGTHEAQTGFTARDAWRHLCDQLDATSRPPAHVAPATWAVGWDVAWDAEEATASALREGQMHPGALLYHFFVTMLESDCEPRTLRVALLRAYQQLGLDGHVDTITTKDIHSPNIRKRKCVIEAVARKELPQEEIRQQLCAAMGTEMVSLEVDPSTTGLCALTITMHGTKEELAAGEEVIVALRQKLSREHLAGLASMGMGSLLPQHERDKLLQCVNEHPVVVVSGPTGCGKSTTVPLLMLLDHNCLGPKYVICTQPRRLGATSLATRVATMCGGQVGDDVGYRIGGMTEFTPGRTRLLYMTNSVAMGQFLRGDVPCTHLLSWCAK